MKLIKIFFVALCFVNFLTFAQEANKTRSFNVNKGGRIIVKLSVGEINVTTWDKNQVSVTADDDEGYFGGIKISQNGNTINVKSSSYSIDHIDVSIPSHFNVELRTYVGNIKINGKIFGRVEVRTSGGNIQVDDVNGDVELKTDSGNITTGKINGAAEITSGGGHLKLGDISGNAQVKSMGGNITMQNVGSNAEIKTAGGNIQVLNINGEAEVKTGGGNISIGNVSKSVQASTGGGNIEITSANGVVEATTGAGGIDLKNITGSVEAASGAGSIYVELTPAAKSTSEINTGIGDIELFIPKNAQTVIDVKASGIWRVGDESKIYSDFPSTKDEDESIKKYILNGGGSNISLQSLMGSIEIRKLK